MDDEIVIVVESSGAKSSSASRRRTPAQFIRKYFLAGDKKANDAEPPPPDELSIFLKRHRKAIALCVPLLIVHAIYWTLAAEYGFWQYFCTRYKIAIVMSIAAFIGGGTAEGAGAIMFPVLTLAFQIPTTTARDFCIMIQSIDLNSAALSLQLMGQLIESRAVFFCLVGGVGGTIFSLQLLDNLISEDVKNIAFVTIFFAFAVAFFLLNKEKKRQTFDRIQDFNTEKAAILIATGVVGGLFSGLAGSGLEVIVFSILSLLFRIDEKVAIPTTIPLAGINSAVAFFWRFNIQHALNPVAWEYLAVAVPVATLFAPLGFVISSNFHRQTLAVPVYIIETTTLISAFLIVMPNWPMCVVAVIIIALALTFYIMIGKVGEKRYNPLPRERLRRLSAVKIIKKRHSLPATFMSRI